MMESDTPLKVLIIGSGPAGLVNARTLLDDGFDVTVVSRESRVGGCWAETYPDLTTNSPWGAFTFSGLDMPRPSSHDGSVVPARTYTRYLEDFYHHFVEGRAKTRFNTEVVSLQPVLSGRGWVALLSQDGFESKQTFDRVVVATGILGKPFIPSFLSSSRLPLLHTSELPDTQKFTDFIGAFPPSSEKPDTSGDGETILIIGGGKSGMDAASLFCNRGRKVIWCHRGELGWFAPNLGAQAIGAGRLDIFMGPSRHMDSWAMWFYHKTWLGAKWTKAFRAMVHGLWSSAYGPNLPIPTKDPILNLANFAGGIPQGPNVFRSQIGDERIGAITGSISKINESLVSFKDGQQIRCGGIIAATGYAGGAYDFIDIETRRMLGLEKVPPTRAGWEERVRRKRGEWKTIQGEEIKGVKQPLVYRGILPIGRFEQRDIAITGGTRAFVMPALTYEVESHWISSMFKEDPFLRLPSSRDECEKEIEGDNEFNLARYPGVELYAQIESGTYVTSFNAISHSRQLLRDLSLDPWGQKSSKPWWDVRRIWDWLDVPLQPGQYEGLGTERRVLREKWGKGGMVGWKRKMGWGLSWV